MIELALGASLLTGLLGYAFGRRRAQARGHRGDSSTPNAHTLVSSKILHALPGALLVYQNDGRVVAYNDLARVLFLGDSASVHASVLTLISSGSDALQAALAADRDEVLNLRYLDSDEVFYVAKRQVESPPSASPEGLNILSAQWITSSVHRHKVETWKTLVRTLSHELNNSLAPILSLMSSAGRLSVGAPNSEKLNEIFRAVRERGEHLGSFLSTYAAIARVPQPNKRTVRVAVLGERLRTLYPLVCVQCSTADGTAMFDEAQIEQVLVNLVTNALESESEVANIEVSLALVDETVNVSVSDRGSGFSSEALASAFTPSFSTKPKGLGIGLAFSREIVELHGGRIRVHNREGGGASVTFVLAVREDASMPRFTITL
jgi:two-component system, NtrC family, nitrogen regulation sensor histidine kinase NtrY